jgi:uncharacterized protein
MVNNSIILELVERIKEFDPEKIILFGSYANGNPTEDSDVDLLVVKENEPALRNLRIAIRSKLFDIYYNNKFELDLFVDNEEHINYRKNIGDMFYEELLTKGKVLYAK